MKEQDFFTSLVTANHCIKKLNKPRQIELKHITQVGPAKILKELLTISFQLKGVSRVSELAASELVHKDKLKPHLLSINPRLLHFNDAQQFLGLLQEDPLFSDLRLDDFKVQKSLILIHRFLVSMCLICIGLKTQGFQEERTIKKFCKLEVEKQNQRLEADRQEREAKAREQEEEANREERAALSRVPSVRHSKTTKSPKLKKRGTLLAKSKLKHAGTLTKRKQAPDLLVTGPNLSVDEFSADDDALSADPDDHKSVSKTSIYNKHG